MASGWNKQRGRETWATLQRGMCLERSLRSLDAWRLHFLLDKHMGSSLLREFRPFVEPCCETLGIILTPRPPKASRWHCFLEMASRRWVSYQLINPSDKKPKKQGAPRNEQSTPAILHRHIWHPELQFQLRLSTTKPPHLPAPTFTVSVAARGLQNEAIDTAEEATDTVMYSCPQALRCHSVTPPGALNKFTRLPGSNQSNYGSSKYEWAEGTEAIEAIITA